MSSNLCPSLCPVPEITFFETFTSGIPDIAALLPLLGTENCEYALTNGYLYAAASPMSLFGSLGIVQAGFKTLFAGINFSIQELHFNGAQALLNMGFQTQGTSNLSLIMADTEKRGSYVVESQFDKLLEDLHLDNTEIRGVSYAANPWNISMITVTAFTSSLSMLPYIYLNTRAESNLSGLARWLFPAFRAIGGFLTTAIMQIVIQRRILSILKNQLSERNKRRNNNGSKRNQNQSSEGASEGENRDFEKGLECSDPTQHTTDTFTWFLLIVLLLGNLASIFGYVGCFRVVQNTTSSSGSLTWLSSEATLSLFRYILWGYNPPFDAAPPLELTLILDDKPPLPTCNHDDARIWEDKVLPLTRASDFLNSVTSFAGLIKPFDQPGLTLYYTLTRAGPDLEQNNFQPQRSPNEPVLYITIFDHMERTAMVFTQAGIVDQFYSATAPVADLEHGLYETQLGAVINSNNDRIVGSGDIRTMLVDHYQSLLRAINRHAGHNMCTIPIDWTMKASHVISMAISAAPDEGAGWEDEGDDYSSRNDRYFEQGRFDRMRKLLDDKRGRWVEIFMGLVIAETRELFQDGKTLTRKFDTVLADEAPATGESIMTTDEDRVALKSYREKSDSEIVELMMIDERVRMETLLVLEVEEWERKLWNVTQEFIQREDVREKEYVKRGWKANCWKRLDANIRAVNARMEAAKVNAQEAGNNLSWEWQEAHERIQAIWRCAVDHCISPDRTSAQVLLTFDRERLTQDLITSPTYPGESRFSRQQDEMERRLGKELEDVQIRLDQGLERCNEFWVDENLLRCRHSRSKWLRILPPIERNFAHMDVYSRALKTRDDIIYIDFRGCEDDWVADTIRNIPHLTSIYTDSKRLGNNQHHTPLFIDKPGADIAAFLKHNALRIAETRRTFIYINNGYIPDFTVPTQLGLSPSVIIVISFVGPISDSLTLRLRHRASAPNAILVIGDMTGLPAFEFPIPSMLTSDDVVLRPHATPSSCISFEGGARHNLSIRVRVPSLSTIEPCYWLQDIQLLDEREHDYNPDIQLLDNAVHGPVQFSYNE